MINSKDRPNEQKGDNQHDYTSTKLKKNKTKPTVRWNETDWFLDEDPDPMASELPNSEWAAEYLHLTLQCFHSGRGWVSWISPCSQFFYRFKPPNFGRLLTSPAHSSKRPWIPMTTFLGTEVIPRKSNNRVLSLTARYLTNGIVISIQQWL